MARSKNRCRGLSSIKSALLPLLIASAFFLLGTAGAAEPTTKFDRSYSPGGPAHLTISNVNGDVTVTAWNRKTISVRAVVARSVSIHDDVSGDDITISVKQGLRLGRADFEASVPPETSISVKNLMGKIVIGGVNGHVAVNSFDGDVRLHGIRSPSIDVKLTSGDIFFEGELSETGTYALQSVKGDIDVSLPASSSFNLNARALSENISLGEFLSSLTGASKGPKGVSGTYLKGGPRLTLTTYSGRILLHKR